MKAVKKFKLQKNHITLIVLSLVLVLLIAGYLIVDAVIAALPDEKEKPTYDLEEGESLFAGVPVAYPRVEEKQMTYIYIDNHEATFDLTRMGSEFVLGFGDLDGDKIPDSYLPPIVGAEGDFEYSTLYAVKMGADGSTAEGYLLTYLISGIGTLYFDERISLPSNSEENGEAKRKEMLAKYGFSENEIKHVYFYYDETVKGEDGKTETVSKMRHIALGKQPRNNLGYYYMVADENGYRDVIYYTSNNYLDYCVGGFETFIKGQLIAPGIPSDTTYGPNLTTALRHWRNKLHDTEGEAITSDAELVVVQGTSRVPLNKGPSYILPEGAQTDGYTGSELKTMNFNLKEMRDSHPDYERFIKQLAGKKVGKYYDVSTSVATGEPLHISLRSPLSESESKLLDFEKATTTHKYEYTIHSIVSVKGSQGLIDKEGTVVGKNSLVTALVTLKIDGVEQYTEPKSTLIDLTDVMISDKDEESIRKLKIGEIDGGFTYSITYHELVYKYFIMGIDAVITETEELTEVGTFVGDNDLVIISYNYFIDGEIANSVVRHAMLDLSDPSLPAEVVEKIRAQRVGMLDPSEYFEFELLYSEREAKRSAESMVITAITAIYNAEGALTDEVKEDSYVTFDYYQMIEGRKTSTSSITISMKDADEKKWEGLRKLLLGKKCDGGYELELYSRTYFYETMEDFVTYVVYDIDYFITSEIVVSFAFVNASERDPFYGDIYFKNELNNAYKLYGLNASSCENLVRFLGGFSNDSTSAPGLSGETVAVGLTFDNMVKYGLFAHSIYFELPRGIYDKTEVEGEEERDENGNLIIGDELAEYGWYGTLGFNLYISEVKVDTDGVSYRYVGSDMYDLIAKVPAEGFEFLDASFVDFWARPYLVLMNINNLDYLSLDFNMEDLSGEFEFELEHEIWYVGMENGKVVAKLEPFTGSSKANKQFVTVTPSSDAMDTKLGEIMANKGLDELSLSVLYNELYNGGKEYYVNGSVDTVGVSNFKEAFSILQMTQYHGTVTDEERELVHGDEPMAPIMTMKVKVVDRSRYYVYDFYRFADRKVMVTMYTVDASGNLLDGGKTSDFFITTRAFQKIVRGFVGVLNGETISTVPSYPDEK